jgi:hypothetical protein
VLFQVTYVLRVTKPSLKISDGLFASFASSPFLLLSIDWRESLHVIKRKKKGFDQHANVWCWEASWGRHAWSTYPPQEQQHTKSTKSSNQLKRMGDGWEDKGWEMEHTVQRKKGTHLSLHLIILVKNNFSNIYSKEQLFFLSQINEVACSHPFPS